jgi:propanediol dehydratase large subunit
MKPNGTKDSIIKWGTFYGLDTKQQGAFEVATSNFVLTYHVDAANADDVMEDFW